MANPGGSVDLRFPKGCRNASTTNVNACFERFRGVVDSLQCVIVLSNGGLREPRFRVLAAELVRGILGGLPRFFPIAAILLCRPYRSDPTVSVLLYRNPVVVDPG